MKNKVCNSFSEAVADVPDAASVMITCLLGPAGIPQNLTLALRDQGAKGLTVYACANFGWVGGTRIRPGLKDYITPGVLVENNQVKKAIVTWGRGDSEAANVLEKAARAGQIEVEFIPVGVYAQKVSAGGSGLGAFYSPVGIGTVYERGKEKRIIDGRKYIFELPIRAQVGLVRAHKADRRGNLVYLGTARGFNPLIARACDLTIAEVDEIVEAGELNPNEIVTPGIYVDRIVKIPEGGWK